MLKAPADRWSCRGTGGPERRGGAGQTPAGAPCRSPCRARLTQPKAAAPPGPTTSASWENSPCTCLWGPPSTQSASPEPTLSSQSGSLSPPQGEGPPTEITRLSEKQETLVNSLAQDPVLSSRLTSMQPEASPPCSFPRLGQPSPLTAPALVSHHPLLSPPPPHPPRPTPPPAIPLHKDATKLLPVTFLVLPTCSAALGTRWRLDLPLGPLHSAVLPVQRLSSCPGTPTPPLALNTGRCLVPASPTDHILSASPEQLLFSPGGREDP